MHLQSFTVLCYMLTYWHRSLVGTPVAHELYCEDKIMCQRVDDCCEIASPLQCIQIRLKLSNAKERVDPNGRPTVLVVVNRCMAIKQTRPPETERPEVCN